MFIRSIIKILNKIKTYKEVDCNSVKGFNEEFLFIYFLLLDKLMNKVQNSIKPCKNPVFGELSYSFSYYSDVKHNTGSELL